MASPEFFITLFLGFAFGSAFTTLIWYIIISKEDKRNEDIAFKSELLKVLREKGN